MGCFSQELSGKSPPASFTPAKKWLLNFLPREPLSYSPGKKPGLQSFGHPP